MLASKYFLYLANGPGLEVKIGLSSNLRIDAAWLEQFGYSELQIYQPPQSLRIAETVLEQLQAQPGLSSRKFFKKVKQIIVGLGGWHNGRLQSVQLRELASPLPDLADLEQPFWGRCLLGTELPEAIRAFGYNLPWNPEDWMQQLYLQGKIYRIAAVGTDRFGMAQCRRCGSTEGIFTTHCLSCGDPHCLVCSNCQTMGLAKSCIPLYYCPYPAVAEETQEVQPVFEFELTPAQQRASQELLRFLDSREEQRQFLVWAVCGGGKTEVCFNAVARILSRGGRVLIAIPRKDVVIELLPRFEKAFPAFNLKAFYGGSRGRWSDARLVLATTHQCLRFFQSFDLVVLDEADAFPYRGSQTLHYALERALKPAGRLIIMTATPDRELLTQAQRGKLPFVSIPARHHRQPLTVPRFIKERFQPFQAGRWEVPQSLQQQLLQAQMRQRKVLVFLPTIRLIETVGREICAWGAAHGLVGRITHSKSDNSVAVKESLQQQQLDFVVTSTVLERGVTIPDLDVAVLFADYEAIFDCRTLVQIAGRAGRRGDPAIVLFYAATLSREMQECCRWIEQMNQEGLQLGYLDPPGCNQETEPTKKC